MSTSAYETLDPGPWLQIGAPRRFALRRVRVACDVARPIRLVHLTDLHLRPGWSSSHDRLLGLISDQSPDVIVCTGDWIDDKFDHRAAMPVLRRLVEGLLPLAPGGVVSIVGNHDGDFVAPRLMQMGVRTLMNQTLTQELEGRSVEWVALAGVARVDLDERFVASLGPKRPGVPRVVLSHFPDAVRSARRLKPDLMLAGHTHGGQVTLPRRGWRDRGGRPLITHDALDFDHASGLHSVEGVLLYTGRGLGTTGLHVRLFSPAELTVVELA